MNKILLSTEESLNGVIDLLEITESTDYIVKDKIVIREMRFLYSDFLVNFELLENASLIFGNTINISNIKGKIQFISTSQTHLVFHLGIHAQGHNELVISNIVEGNSNKSEIKVRMIAEANAKMVLKTVGELKEKTVENEFLEDIKYLNEFPGAIVCFPELLVSSNEVIANHNMTVGTMDPEALFYLQSKGIPENIAKQLIRENFIKCMIRKE